MKKQLSDSRNLTR